MYYIYICIIYIYVLYIYVYYIYICIIYIFAAIGNSPLFLHFLFWHLDFLVLIYSRLELGISKQHQIKKNNRNITSFLNPLPKYNIM